MAIITEELSDYRTVCDCRTPLNCNVFHLRLKFGSYENLPYAVGPGAHEVRGAIVMKSALRETNENINYDGYAMPIILFAILVLYSRYPIVDRTLGLTA